jgi:hypothetical protein
MPRRCGGEIVWIRASGLACPRQGRCCEEQKGRKDRCVNLGGLWRVARVAARCRLGHQWASLTPSAWWIPRSGRNPEAERSHYSSKGDVCQGRHRYPEQFGSWATGARRRAHSGDASAEGEIAATKDWRPRRRSTDAAGVASAEGHSPGMHSAAPYRTCAKPRTASAASRVTVA